MTEQTVNQTSYYPQVECEARKGDADWEVVVAVKDEKGRRQFLSVSNGMIARENEKTYLAIGIVEVDVRNQLKRLRRLLGLCLHVVAESGMDGWSCDVDADAEPCEATLALDPRCDSRGVG